MRARKALEVGVGEFSRRMGTSRSGELKSREIMSPISISVGVWRPPAKILGRKNGKTYRCFNPEALSQKRRLILNYGRTDVGPF